MSESLHLSTHIARPAAEVYAFAADPAHLPEWAAGLSGAIEQRDGRWFAVAPMGEVEVRFVEANPYGVLDHDVTLPDGTTVTNPMRVIADGDECEVVFTLRRGPSTTDEELAADERAVRADLATLRELLESLGR
jgi:uncharacterized protein YndB with AHSA1/START domain